MAPIRAPRRALEIESRVTVWSCGCAGGIATMMLRGFCPSLVCTLPLSTLLLARLAEQQAKNRCPASSGDLAPPSGREVQDDCEPIPIFVEENIRTAGFSARKLLLYWLLRKQMRSAIHAS